VSNVLLNILKNVLQLQVNTVTIRGCNQKFPDWPPGARTTNGIVLCH